MLGIAVGCFTASAAKTGRGWPASIAHEISTRATAPIATEVCCMGKSINFARAVLIDNLNMFSSSD
jgi:hypothetical protein